MVQYSFIDIIRNIKSLLFTKVFYPHARLVRWPIYRFGPKFIYGIGFTTGRGCRIDIGESKSSLIIGKDARLGDYVHINAERSITIGDNVLMASHVFISDASHGSYSGDNQSSPDSNPSKRDLVIKPVKIGNNVWIGEHVVILQGAEIGDGCIIGANTVISGKTYPDNSIIAGVPGRVIKQFRNGEWVRV